MKPRLRQGKKIKLKTKKRAGGKQNGVGVGNGKI